MTMSATIAHLVILNANKLVSRDSGLLLVISTLKQNAISDLGNLQHVLDPAVNSTTIMEAEELLHRLSFTLTSSP